MHHRLLITLDFPAGADSADVRGGVYKKLMDDDSFCGEGGVFGSPLCDWFVIGGRLERPACPDRHRRCL